MVIGCMWAAIGGSLLATLATAFNSGSWQTPDTFGVWMAMLIGGAGNRWGVLLGATLTYEIGEGTRAIPSLAAHPALVADLRLMLTGVVLIIFLRFRPQGILPDRRPKYDRAPKAEPKDAALVGVGAPALGAS
jgi:ABC-type branched-subunit amino acid transport system permease subunit